MIFGQGGGGGPGSWSSKKRKITKENGQLERWKEESESFGGEQGKFKKTLWPRFGEGVINLEGSWARTVGRKVKRWKGGGR